MPLKGELCSLRKFVVTQKASKLKGLFPNILNKSSIMSTLRRPPKFLFYERLTYLFSSVVLITRFLIFILEYVVIVSAKHARTVKFRALFQIVVFDSSYLPYLY